MKMKQKNKIKWMYIITVILAFGFAYSKELKREDVGETVFYYRVPNKTQTLQIQPRIGASIRVPRQQSKAYAALRNGNEPIVTENKDFNINGQPKSSVDTVLEVPILIYRGPHRPRELYQYRQATTSKRGQNPNYVGAASRQIAINQSNGRNNRFQQFQHSKSTKRHAKHSFESIAGDEKGRHLSAKTLYEDISILQDPHVESAIGRHSSPKYYVPQKQNYAIYAGGKYSDTDSRIESFSSGDYSVGDQTDTNERSSHIRSSSKVGGGTKRQSSTANRSKTLYSRNDMSKNFTPFNLPNHPHPANDKRQFKVMDHYDGGFGPSKLKRENPAFHQGANNFGIEFDYENYDTVYRPITRLHRASKLQPEYDGDLNFHDSSSLQEPIRPLQNKGTTKRNRNGRQRRRKGHVSTTTSGFDVATDYETEPYQSGTDFQSNNKYEEHQSSTKGSGRKTNTEGHDTFATTAAIEDTYANVELRRTQPKTTSKSSQMTSGRNRRRKTSRVTN